MGCLTYFSIKKNNNKRIVTLKEWVIETVFLFCRQCFSAS